MKEKYVTIRLPKSLVEKIKRRIEDSTTFQSVSEYITFVLQEIVSNSGREEKVTFTRGEEEKIKKRLKALGYI